MNTNDEHENGSEYISACSNIILTNLADNNTHQPTQFDNTKEVAQNIAIRAGAEKLDSEISASLAQLMAA